MLQKHATHRLLTTLLLMLSLQAQAHIEYRSYQLTTSDGLSNNYVRHIMQDSEGYIWLSTLNGLARYDGHSFKVLTVDDTPQRRLLLSNRIYMVREWKGRYLWVVLGNRQYSCYDKQTDSFVNPDIIRSEMTAANANASSKDHTVTDNRHNTIQWNESGLLVYQDSARTKTLHIQLPVRFDRDPRLRVVTAQDGRIWIATFGWGLFVYEPEHNQLTTLSVGEGVNNAISTRYLLYLMEDRQGNIWISQENMGVKVLNIRQTGSQVVLLSDKEPGSHLQAVRMLTRADDGNILAASYERGLWTMGQDGRLTALPDSYGSGVIAAERTPEGQLIVGTRDNGLFIGQQHYRHDDHKANNIASDKVGSILYDRKGRLWLACMKGGVDMMAQDGTFRHYLQGHDPHVLTLDHRGHIWVGTSDGVIRFHPDQLMANAKSYETIRLYQDVHHNEEVHAIYEDQRHRLWVAYAGDGVACFNNTGNQPRLLQHFTTRQGLSDNWVESVIEDADGHIWVGTLSGLSCYDEREQMFYAYRLSNQPLRHVCMEQAVCRLDDGRLAFGTKYGIVMVRPEELRSQHVSKDFCISEVSIDGTTMTCLLSDFGYDPENRLRYTYYLEGYDKEWTALTNEYRMTYRRLPPGCYVLHVKSCDAGGTWNDKEATYAFEIPAPFYRTWWAYLLYALAAILIGYFLWRNQSLRRKMKMDEELTEYKLRFFTNVSHEFRTPLTIINGAMERIREAGEMPAAIRQPVSSMQKSVNRLMRLINQLLEFRKMQNNKLSLAVERDDIVEFIRNIMQSFKVMADNRGITLTFSTQKKTLLTPFDHRYVEMAVYNLLSNALKYTPAKGSVEVRCKMEDGRMDIVVTDTGVGIPKEKQPQLFQRFMNGKVSADSMGIGLNLTAEMMRVHHGSIRFEENPEGGSTFTITLPTNEDAYTADEWMREEKQQLTVNHESLTVNNYQEMTPLPLNEQVILVVEDDDDVRDFTCHELGRYFSILTARNGEEAWKLLQKQRPDLIISDVMMPVMNGYELLKRVKKEPKLGTIPFILLTALTTDEKKQKGFNVGADAYVEKPFSVDVLVAQCRQLIEQRSQLKLSYIQQASTNSLRPSPVTEVITDEVDRRFRDAFDSYVRNHISDPSMNVDELARKMGYGRSRFYKRVQALTGMTPMNYIINVRMDMAKEMLKDDTMTIAEIAYQLGFNSASYFTRMFKAQTGISPKEYRTG